jgi:hypothetical protein
MINITTPIVVTNNINSLRRLEMVNFIDNWQDATPSAAVLVQFFGGVGMKKYGVPVWLVAKDSDVCTVATANTNSVEFDDMVKLAQVEKAGAYTAITGAFYSGNRTRPQRYNAVEAILPQWLLGSEFAGT